jgi:hypothetical protein
MARSSGAVTMRWIARIISLANLGILLTFAVGELSPSGPRPTSAEWVGLAFFPVGVIVGLIFGWLSERWGGFFVLASLSGFYLWNFVQYESWPRGPFFVLFSLGGFVFLLSAFVSHYSESRV